jgi:hypothetical protein
VSACGAERQRPSLTSERAGARGTTYYVSPNGSDRDPGTTRRLAWKTVARVDRQQLVPGDVVLFKAGSSFAGAPLIPNVVGAGKATVVLGTFGGHDRAKLPGGVYFTHLHDLRIEHFLIAGPQIGIHGSGKDIAIASCELEDVSIGIEGRGSGWTIAGNIVRRTGDSGMLLYGSAYQIVANTIVDTGLNRAIPYGKHGIYLKAADSTAAHNTIRSFTGDGISVRYRNSTIRHNTITDGPVGIAWFQYDRTPGVSRWTDNTIADTTAAGIYVSSRDAGTRTIESFTIDSNTIRPKAGVPMNLQPIGGTYSVSDNRASPPKFMLR